MGGGFSLVCTLASCLGPSSDYSSLLPLPARTCSLDLSLCFVESVWQSEHQIALLLCLKAFRDFSPQENKAIASVITSSPPSSLCLWPPFQCSDMPIGMHCWGGGVPDLQHLPISTCQCSLTAGFRLTTEHGVGGCVHPGKSWQAHSSPGASASTQARTRDPAPTLHVVVALTITWISGRLWELH